jgi:hypothetical protein
MAEVQRDTMGSAEDTIHFLQMVSLFGTQAMVALGKVINPSTGKSERHLPVAKMFIDTLEMLERKTRGNLNKDEARTLQATLTDLRMMYVEECKAGDTPPSASETESPAPSDKTDATATDDESKVKFHKKYE